MYKEKRLFAKHKKKRPKTMSKFINPFTDCKYSITAPFHSKNVMLLL